MEDVSVIEVESATEKNDGVTLHAGCLSGEIRLFSRIGIARESIEAEKRLSYSHYSLCKHLLDACYSPSFEWVRPDVTATKWVGRDCLIFLEARHLTNGTYLPVDEVRRLASKFGVLTSKLLTYNGSIEELCNEVGQQVSMEGAIVHAAGRPYAKIKTLEYIRRERIASLRSDRALLKEVLSEGIDDLYPFLDQEDVSRVQTQSAKAGAALNALSAGIEADQFDALERATGSCGGCRDSRLRARQLMQALLRTSLRISEIESLTHQRWT